ncbi:MAG: hypothetical protein ABI220_05300 [Candidatus Saccharimonadales bacterium]
MRTPETAPQWQEEFFYFGNANYPSDATYRTSGERIQLQIEKGLPLTKKEGSSQFTADASEVTEFLATHEDCSLLVADSHEVHEQYGGGRTEPVLWVIGWKELTSDEERAGYLEDKAIGDKR